jgi:hypothetical protein
MFRKNIILVFLLTLPFHKMHAQDWFSGFKKGDKLDGYVIGIAGDTIPGLIQFDYPVAMQKQLVFFKSNPAETTPVTYGPAHIRGYGINDKRWLSAQVMMETYDGTYKFARFGLLETIPGPLALLRVFEEADKKKKKLNSDQASKIYKNISYEMDHGSYQDLFIKKYEDPAMAVSSKEFKKSFQKKMLLYVGDHQDLKQMIIDKSWGYKDLEKIVNEYNRWYAEHKPSR